MLSVIEAAGWPIWFLICCSVLALALVLERSLSLTKAKVLPEQLLLEAIEGCKDGAPNAGWVARLQAGSVLGQVLGSGLNVLCVNPLAASAEVEQALVSAGRRAERLLNQRLVALATIASSAPLLGLFGTVVGMIEIFGAQNGAGSTPGQLAHGISVALYNTAFGLMVAIPTLIFWRYFKDKADGYLLELEIAAQEWLQQLPIERQQQREKA